MTAVYIINVYAFSCFKEIMSVKALVVLTEAFVLLSLNGKVVF